MRSTLCRVVMLIADHWQLATAAYPSWSTLAEGQFFELFLHSTTQVLPHPTPACYVHVNIYIYVLDGDTALIHALEHQEQPDWNKSLPVSVWLQLARHDHRSNARAKIKRLSILSQQALVSRCKTKCVGAPPPHKNGMNLEGSSK